MTDNEMRIAIAEACPNWIVRYGGRYCVITNCPDGPLLGRLFDPLEDLNAMHEAEKDAIEPYDILAYALHLNQILVRDWTPDRWNDFDAMGRNYAFSRATARQRAEAFCRAKGIWKD